MTVGFDLERLFQPRWFCFFNVLNPSAYLYGYILSELETTVPAHSSFSQCLPAVLLTRNEETNFDQLQSVNICSSSEKPGLASYCFLLSIKAKHSKTQENRAALQWFGCCLPDQREPSWTDVLPVDSTDCTLRLTSTVGHAFLLALSGQKLQQDDKRRCQISVCFTDGAELAPKPARQRDEGSTRMAPTRSNCWNWLVNHESTDPILPPVLPTSDTSSMRRTKWPGLNG